MESKNQISNPYLKVGRLHNEGLDFVIKNLNPKEKPSIDQVLDLTGQYMLELKDSKSRNDLALYYEFVATNINSLTQTPFFEIVKQANLTKEAVCFINDVKNVSDEFDLPTTLKVLLNIQDNILSSDMSEIEKQYPLLSVAVGINSVEYWIRQINDPRSPWTPFVGDPKAFKWPWKSDANGAVAGGIGGAIGGATAGLGGALVGGLLGAIGGAIGQSVADALFS